MAYIKIKKKEHEDYNSLTLVLISILLFSNMLS